MNPDGPQQFAAGTFHAAHGVGGVIALGLLLVFGLQILGFRFVVAAGVGRP